MRVPSHCVRAVLFVWAFSVSGLNAYIAAQEPLPQTQSVLLQMIRDEAIHRELGLSDDQVARLMDALREVDPPWFRARVLPAEKQRDEIAHSHRN